MFNYWVYAVVYMFISIIIGQFFIEDDIKLVYYMISFLLYIFDIGHMDTDCNLLTLSHHFSLYPSAQA